MNKVVFALSLFFLLYSCKPENGFRLDGTIEGLSESTVYLQQRIDKEYVSVDSSNMADGIFSFSGQVQIPDVYYIIIPGIRGRALLFLENSNLRFSAHADTLWEPDVTGSSVHDEYLAYQAGIESIYDKLVSLYEQYRTASMAGDTAIASELEKQMDAVYESVEGSQQAFIEENPTSYLSPFVLQSLHYGKEGVEIEELLDKLDPSLGATTLVTEMRKRVEVLNTVAIGQMAPDFTLSDQDGHDLQLSSLRGNYLLLDFWAAWCGPCRRENPNIVAAYNKYHERGFDILGVSLDNSREDWLMAIRNDGLTWNHVSDIKGWSNAAAQMYGISSIPSNLLLDPEGKIISKNLRGEDLHVELEKLLAP